MNNESTTKTIEIIEDSSFTFDGYQVVRGEFFAHVYEPSITLNNYKVSVNTACIRKLPEFDYVQILVNPETKKLAVRPCREDEKDYIDSNRKIVETLDIVQDDNGLDDALDFLNSF